MRAEPGPTTMTTKPTAITPWLAFCNPRPDARLRLFCFPYAGGGATFYRDWASALPPQVDVCPVQLPGRETRIREEPLTELDSLVEEAAAALSPYFDRPYCFVGYSMGALVAFELARHLHRDYGTCPSHLITCGYRAPHLSHSSTLRHDLPRDEFIKELGDLEGTPSAALESPELIDFMLPIIRADCRICDLYEFRNDEPLPCSITAYGGTEDADAGEAMLLPWRDLTRSTFSLKMFPGGHFFVQNSRREFLTAVAAELRQLMERK